MKRETGRIARRRKYFARCFDDNPEWRYEHANDRKVFHKIASVQKRTGEHPLTIVRRLMCEPGWSDRLKGKLPKSWKDCYNRWRRKSQSASVDFRLHRAKSETKLKWKNMHLTPENIG